MRANKQTNRWSRKAAENGECRRSLRLISWLQCFLCGGCRSGQAVILHAPLCLFVVLFVPLSDQSSRPLSVHFLTFEKYCNTLIWNCNQCFSGYSAGVRSITTSKGSELPYNHQKMHIYVSVWFFLTQHSLSCLKNVIKRRGGSEPTYHTKLHYTTLHYIQLTSYFCPFSQWPGVPGGMLFNCGAALSPAAALWMLCSHAAEMFWQQGAAAAQLLESSIKAIWRSCGSVTSSVTFWMRIKYKYIYSIQQQAQPVWELQGTNYLKNCSCELSLKYD